MNILIIADIHIGSYPKYNVYPGARLEQYDKLASRIKEISEEKKCEELWILGDFLKVPVPEPKIMHKCLQFLQEISGSFKNVKYILGNHDLNAKSNNLDMKDSLITVLDIPNFEYVDHKIIDYNGKKVAFMNWYPKHDLTWYDGCVDLLATHYTHSTLFGKPIDESKFDKIVFGDIHKSYINGKYYSVGTPFQLDMSSQENGTCILLNTDNMSMEHIKLDPEHKLFLKMKYTKNEKCSGPTKNGLTWYIYKPDIFEKQDEKININSVDIDTIIDSHIENEGLQSCHNEIKKICTDTDEIDFNFQLISLDIIGYRSIVEFHMDFEAGDRICIVGKNGSGKSSIINSLKACFEKARNMKSSFSDFTTEHSVKLKLKYGETEYTIVRGEESEFYINDIQQKYNNKTLLEEDILNHLPFFKYLDLFFITADTSNLNDKLTPERRIELISKFFRLDKIDAYNKTAEEILEQKMTELSPVLEEYKSHKAVYDNAESQRNIKSESLKGKSEQDIKLLLQISQDKLNAIRNAKNTANTINSIKDNINSLNKRIIDNENLLKEFESSELLGKREEIVEKYDQLQNEASNLTARSTTLKRLQNELAEIRNSGVDLKNKIIEIKEQKCPTCGQLIDDRRAKQLMDTLMPKLKKASEDYILKQKEIEENYNEYELKPSYFENRSKAVLSELNYYSEEKRKIDISIAKVPIIKKNIENYKLDLEKAEESLKLINVQDESVLDDESEIEIETKIDNLKTILNDFAIISAYENSMKDELKAISEIKKNIDEKEKEIDIYKKYLNLTAQNGQIYNNIMKVIADNFSDEENNIRYILTSTTRAGKVKLNFEAQYKVKKNYRDYSTLSSGQSTVCDIHFLNRLFKNGSGLLVLDESLKFLDDDNIPLAESFMKEMNVKTLIASTHSPNMTLFNKRLSLELDDEGKTKFEEF